MNLLLSRILKDVRFWLLFFILIRLIGISDPPLEVSHNWRQSTVNMIARNYYHGETRFLYPMMDNAGEKSGITGTEFPLFNQLISFCARILGWEHWYGRLINLLVTSLGIYFFYRWIKEFIDSKTAFASTMILLVSLWFSFSRKIMPDTFSVSIVFIGLYYGYRYFRDKKSSSVLLYIMFSSLGVLCKLPAIIALSPLAFLFIKYLKEEKTIPFTFVAASLVILGIAFYWYFYWFNHLIALGNWQFYMMGPSFGEGIKQLISMPKETLDNFYFESLKFTGFIAFLMGIYYSIKLRHYTIAFPFLLWSIAFLVFISKAGSGFSTHDYYTIPFVPAMALLAGFGVSKLPKNSYQIIALLIISIEGIANQHHDFRIKDKELVKLNLENICDTFSTREDRVVINTGMNPQSIYFCNRKGWSMESSELNKEKTLDSLNALGAQFLIIDKLKAEFQVSYGIVYQDSNYSIYDLNDKIKLHE